MNANCLNQKNIEIYLQYLKEQEKSAGTLEKYKRELYELLTFFIREKRKQGRTDIMESEIRTKILSCWCQW